jgi:hypothetical protein
MNWTFRSDVPAAPPRQTSSRFSPLIIVSFNWMFSGICICTRLLMEVELLCWFGFKGFPDVPFYRGRAVFFGGSWSRRFDLIFLFSFNCRMLIYMENARNVGLITLFDTFWSSFYIFWLILQVRRVVCVQIMLNLLWIFTCTSFVSRVNFLYDTSQTAM